MFFEDMDTVCTGDRHQPVAQQVAHITGVCFVQRSGHGIAVDALGQRQRTPYVVIVGKAISIHPILVKQAAVALHQLEVSTMV